MPSRPMCFDSMAVDLGIQPDFSLLTQDEDRVALLEPPSP